MSGIMRKTCVYITGTNGVGKTTLAKALIEHYGGVKTADKELTLCNDERVCFAGKYGESNYGGVDIINQTKSLQGIVKKALKTQDVIFCEGSFMNNFGLNLTNAMFEAEKHLVVYLYAPVRVIHSRLLSRSGRGVSKDVVDKQNCGCSAARKWDSIGVPVLSFDTSKVEIGIIIQQIIKIIEK